MHCNNITMRLDIITYKLYNEGGEILGTLGGYPAHNKCLSELEELIIHPKTKRQFTKKFAKRMQEYTEFGNNIFSYIKEWETLSDTMGICSMHTPVYQVNIRILFSLKEETLTFLVAFNEDSGSTNTSYKPHVKKAQNRLKEM